MSPAPTGCVGGEGVATARLSASRRGGPSRGTKWSSAADGCLAELARALGKRRSAGGRAWAYASRRHAAPLVGVATSHLMCRCCARRFGGGRSSVALVGVASRGGCARAVDSDRVALARPREGAGRRAIALPSRALSLTRHGSVDRFAAHAHPTRTWNTPCHLAHSRICKAPFECGLDLAALPMNTGPGFNDDSIA